MPIYYIEESRFYKFTKKLNRFKTLCEHHNNVVFNVEYLENVFKKENNVINKFHKVNVECFVRDKNWLFIGEIEHRKNKNLIRKVVNINMPDRFNTSEGFCDHCKGDRKKQKTYIFKYHDEWYQFGRHCIPTCTDSIEIESCIDAIDSLKMCEEENYFYVNMNENKTAKPFYDNNVILNYAVESVKKNGYVKKTNEYGIPVGNSTYESVMNMIRFSENVDNSEKVESVKKWISNNENDSDFYKTLKSIVKDGFVEFGKISILVSLIPMYNNDTKIVNSRFYGREEQNVDIDVVRSEMAGSYQGQYGKVFVYKFTDKNGYIFVTHLTYMLNNIGLVNHISGMIKNHYIYKNEKQTILTGVKTKAPC